jgi:cation diffusion facilitator CzcD-associated flavoprotein CzcO
MSEIQRRVAIIGAGVAGLTQAIALKTKLKFHNFTIYEKGSEVGGVWRTNTYPGCSSDIEIHCYSLSTDLYPYWDKSHGLQPEIPSGNWGVGGMTRRSLETLVSQWSVGQT